jgi:hypothetical protein
MSYTNACTTGSTAFREAWVTVASGQTDQSGCVRKPAARPRWATRPVVRSGADLEID